MEINNRINQWYDGIREPWRFLIGLVAAMPFILSTGSNNNFILILGLLYALALIGSRMAWLYRR